MAKDLSLSGMRLSYLIGAGPQQGEPGRVIEVGYDVDDLPTFGIPLGYCNLFDEHNTGAYGPYLHDSDTAAQYDEGQIDPRGPGWEKNLREQFERRQRAGFRIIELDNPDAYEWKNVRGAMDLAGKYGFSIVAKNPMLCESPAQYVAHPLVVGIIVEKDDDHTPYKLHSLRIAAGKPDMPVWFVSFGGGRAWAQQCAGQILSGKFTNMSVTHSSKGEYVNVIDV